MWIITLLIDNELMRLRLNIAGGETMAEGEERP